VPPVAELRDCRVKLILALEKADISRLLATGWKPPMPITVKARDGVTDLYGPDVQADQRLDESMKYPIVNHIYPGRRPAASAAALSRSRAGDAQALAELGFVVVEIDGMGTPWRSKKFHEAYYGNMGDNTLADQGDRHETAGREISRGSTSTAPASTDTRAAATPPPTRCSAFPISSRSASRRRAIHDNRVYEDDWAEKWQGLLKTRADGSTNYDNQAEPASREEPQREAAARARHDGHQRAARTTRCSSSTR
jgi:hypothetical protein